MKVTIEGSISVQTDAAMRDVARSLRRAVTTTAQQAQAELRTQARSAGFKDGGRSVANAWRLKTFPASASVATWHPAALVFSKMPDVVDAFDRGKLITAQKKKYLAWPTGYNAAGGRRNAGSRAGLRVTIEQMRALEKKKPREAFVIRAKSNPNVFLWCLKIYEARGLTKRSRAKIIAGSDIEVFTANRKGRAAAAKNLLKQAFIPMFFLKKSVVLRKRWDVDAVAAHARNQLAASVQAELRG